MSKKFEVVGCVGGVLRKEAGFVSKKEQDLKSDQRFTCNNATSRSHSPFSHTTSHKNKREAVLIQFYIRGPEYIF